MAFQSSQKLRSMASPSSVKLGPLKATQTFGLIKGLETSPNGQTLGVEAQSQTNASTRRFSPDSTICSGSSILRDQKGLSNGVGIRRTGSYDLLSSNTYLNGEWPRFGSSIGQACLTCEKFTQTPDEWQCLNSSDVMGLKSGKIAASSISNGDNFKEVRAGGRPGKVKSSIYHRTSTLNGISSANVGKPLQFRGRMTCHCRGSLEGLNQEIERLVMQNNLSSDRTKSPMDGRREPVAYQLNTCSRVTQTPTKSSIIQDNVDGEGGCISRDCDTYDLLDEIDIKVFKDHQESPERVNFHSPKAVNSRLPPDGCEKVEGKFKEVCEDGTNKSEIQFLMPPVVQCHIPSELSAFNPLVKNYLTQSAELVWQFNGLVVSLPHD